MHVCFARKEASLAFLLAKVAREGSHTPVYNTALAVIISAKWIRAITLCAPFSQ